MPNNVQREPFVHRGHEIRISDSGCFLTSFSGEDDTSHSSLRDAQEWLDRRIRIEAKTKKLSLSVLKMGPSGVQTARVTGINLSTGRLTTTPRISGFGSLWVDVPRVRALLSEQGELAKRQKFVLTELNAYELKLSGPEKVSEENYPEALAELEAKYAEIVEKAGIPA